MTISSSLNAGVAGLSANATRLATISDNIANSSTFGYKRAVTDFQSLVIENSRSSYTAGGVRTTTGRLIDERGSLVATSNPTDLAVRGRGMLPVTTEASVQVGNGENPLLLTTTGSFRPDEDGFLRSPAGRDSVDGLEPIKINSNQFAGEPTTEVNLAVNLPATSTEAGSTTGDETLSIEYFDNLGKSANLVMTFSPTVPGTGTANEWQLQIFDSASGGALVGDYQLNFDPSRAGGGTLLNVTDNFGVGLMSIQTVLSGHPSTVGLTAFCIRCRWLMCLTSTDWKHLINKATGFHLTVAASSCGMQGTGRQVMS